MDCVADNMYTALTAFFTVNSEWPWICVADDDDDDDSDDNDA